MFFWGWYNSKCSGFNVFLNCLYHRMVLLVITATMLFLQFILDLSSFVGTLKNEIPGAALELCHLKIKQFPLGILKFSTKHKDNPFTLNCFMVPPTLLFIFHAGWRILGSKNFWNSSYKEKTAGSARVSRLSFRFLWLWSEGWMLKKCFIEREGKRNFGILNLRGTSLLFSI